ncbi:DNA ligase, partial [Acinetobacter baumannii]
IDGEVVALNHHGQPDFSALQAALSEKDTDRLVFFVFDCLFAGGEDLRERPLRERKARLKAFLAGAEARIRYVEHFETAGDVLLNSACRMDL